MKKYIYIIAGIIITALVVFKLASNKNKSEDRIYHYDKEAPIEVETITVNEATLNIGNAYAGTFEANKEVKVTADIQGKIVEMLVDLGSEVKKGQALIQLDNALLKLQLQAAEVTVKGLENDVNRYTILADADAIQGVQLEKATLGLEAAKIQRATLLEQISKTTIKAPFDGVVTMKMTETGAFAAPGIPLLQLTEIQQLRFTIFVAENDIHLFKVNDSYPIVPDNNKEKILQGKIIAVGSQSNPAGSFPVQFIVNNPLQNQLKSGMFGKVQLQQTTATEGLYISVALIQGSEENASVYVVKNNKAVLQKISIKTKIQDKVLVTDGIKQGDVLVSKGFINLFDGANVKMN